MLWHRYFDPEFLAGLEGQWDLGMFREENLQLVPDGTVIAGNVCRLPHLVTIFRRAYTRFRKGRNQSAVYRV